MEETMSVPIESVFHDGRTNLILSYFGDAFYVTIAKWTENGEAITGSHFMLTPEEALRVADIIKERYGEKNA